jgi:hypothetical protein
MLLMLVMIHLPPGYGYRSDILGFGSDGIGPHRGVCKIALRSQLASAKEPKRVSDQVDKARVMTLYYESRLVILTIY